MSTAFAGSGLTLQNGSDTVTISTNGNFAFGVPVASGAKYAVTVKTQPLSPAQTCAVAARSGTVGRWQRRNRSGDLRQPTSFAVTGTVTGLAGGGLVLSDNGTDTLAVAASGAFTFGAKVASGAPYAVKVATQPTGPWQTCAVPNGNGTVGNGNVTGIQVNCQTSTVHRRRDRQRPGGRRERSRTLTINGGSVLPVSANGPFSFPALASGTAYTVATSRDSPPARARPASVTANPKGTLAGAERLQRGRLLQQRTRTRCPAPSWASPGPG